MPVMSPRKTVLACILITLIVYKVMSKELGACYCDYTQSQYSVAQDGTPRL